MVARVRLCRVYGASARWADRAGLWWLFGFPALLEAVLAEREQKRAWVRPAACQSPTALFILSEECSRLFAKLGI